MYTILILLLKFTSKQITVEQVQVKKKFKKGILLYFHYSFTFVLIHNFFNICIDLEQF